MKSDHDSLLQDIIEDIAPAAFREKVLDQMLQKIRQRRRVKVGSRVCASMALAACLFLNLRGRHPQGIRERMPGPESVAMISARPGPVEMTVTPRSASVPSFSSSFAGFGVVRSKPGEALFADLDDDRLLDLLSGQGAAGLVRYEGARAELLPMMQ